MGGKGPVPRRTVCYGRPHLIRIPIPSPPSPIAPPTASSSLPPAPPPWCMGGVGRSRRHERRTMRAWQHRARSRPRSGARSGGRRQQIARYTPATAAPSHARRLALVGEGATRGCGRERIEAPCAVGLRQVATQCPTAARTSYASPSRRPRLSTRPQGSYGRLTETTVTPRLSSRPTPV